MRKRRLCCITNFPGICYDNEQDACWNYSKNLPKNQIFSNFLPSLVYSKPLCFWVGKFKRKHLFFSFINRKLHPLIFCRGKITILRQSQKAKSWLDVKSTNFKDKNFGHDAKPKKKKILCQREGDFQQQAPLLSSPLMKVLMMLSRLHEGVIT